ncbi:hypothetical protein AACH06_25805 [Ideonella sp. DXS29W]|uniref:Histidine phosphatase family protein n=1 Tax=Ideonella lacteola TaxID=2984193 RepID=A0ABU9BWA4_9BURK
MSDLIRGWRRLAVSTAATLATAAGALFTTSSLASMVAPSGPPNPDDWVTPSQVGQTLATLRTGGYVLVMRHATTDPSQVDQQPVDLKDCSTQRNLTDIGRLNARGWGRVLRASAVPVGSVLASEYCRTRETAEYLGYPAWTSNAALTMPVPHNADSEAQQGRALKALVSIEPASGTNTLLITHNVNLVAAFGSDAAQVGEADLIVLKPGPVDASVVARLRIRDVAQYARDTSLLKAADEKEGAK